MSDDEPVVVLDDEADVELKTNAVYADTRTEDRLKLVYYDEPDDFLVGRWCDRSPEGGDHYIGQESQFRRELAAGRWRLVDDPYS